MAAGGRGNCWKGIERRCAGKSLLGLERRLQGEGMWVLRMPEMRKAGA